MLVDSLKTKNPSRLPGFFVPKPKPMRDSILYMDSLTDYSIISYTVDRKDPEIFLRKQKTYFNFTMNCFLNFSTFGRITYWQ